MESKAKHELLQSKAQWEKLESDIRIDQENNKKLKDGQIEALSRLVVILIEFCIRYVPLCRYSIYLCISLLFMYLFNHSFEI